MTETFSQEKSEELQKKEEKKQEESVQNKPVTEIVELSTAVEPVEVVKENNVEEEKPQEVVQEAKPSEVRPETPEIKPEPAVEKPEVVQEAEPVVEVIEERETDAPQVRHTQIVAPVAAMQTYVAQSTQEPVVTTTVESTPVQPEPEPVQEAATVPVESTAPPTDTIQEVIAPEPKIKPDDNDDIANFPVSQARIVVMGCGGGGCNTVDRLSTMGIEGASTVAVNTDAKHLRMVKSEKKILIGKDLTRGLGAGGYPKVGKKAAEESRQDLKRTLKDCDLLFLTCGLGGGTGTGSAPVVAHLAKEMGAIVIAAVTLPFKIEGARLTKAEEGLAKLREVCDTVIVIENQKLVDLAGNKPLREAFGMADGLISTMIKGITETISMPSLVNLDYADVRSIMKAGGVATIGVGESDNTDSRSNEAIQRAMDNPLLDVDYAGASGALIQIIGGEDLKLDEINQIGETVSDQMDPDATVMWGARIIPEYTGKVQVITIVTGVNSPYILGKPMKTPAKKSTKVNDLGIEVLI